MLKTIIGKLEKEKKKDNDVEVDVAQLERSNINATLQLLEIYRFGMHMSGIQIDIQN